jgi:arylsulfatase
MITIKNRLSVYQICYYSSRDPGERYNVASMYPEIVKELQLLADGARQDIGDDLTNAPGSNRRKAGIVK